MVETNPYAEFIPSKDTGLETVDVTNNPYGEFIPTDEPEFQGTRLQEGVIPSLNFPTFTTPVYVDIQDKSGQKIIYLGDSPFKEDYETITNENEKSFFLESFLGFDIRNQISTNKQDEYNAYIQGLVDEVGLEAYFPKEVATISGSLAGPLLLNYFAKNPDKIPKSGSGVTAFRTVFNGLWKFQKATIDKLPLPPKIKKQIKQRYLAGAIAAAGLAGSAGFAYDTVSDYLDGDEETIEEIVEKLPENLKREGINELIGLGILKTLGIGKNNIVLATDAVRNKLSDFYEVGVKPILADVASEGGTFATNFLKSFGRLPLVADKVGNFIKEQGPVVRDKVDKLIQAFAPRSNKDATTTFLESMLKGRAEWKAVTGAAYDNFYRQIDELFGKGTPIFPMVKSRTSIQEFITKADNQASGVLKDTPFYKFSKKFLERTKGKKLTIDDYKFYQDELSDIYNSLPYEDSVTRGLIDDLKTDFFDDLGYLTATEGGAFTVNQAGQITSSVFPRMIDPEKLALLRESKKFADDVFRFGVDRDQALPMGKDFFDKGVFSKMTQTYRQGTDTNDFAKLVGFGDEGYTVNKTITLPGAGETKITQTFSVNQLYQTPLSKEGTQYYDQIFKPLMQKLNSPQAVKQLFKLTGSDPNVFGSFIFKLMDDSMNASIKALNQVGENTSTFSATKNFLNFDPVKFRNGIFGTNDQMKKGIMTAFDLLHARNPKEFISGKQLEKLLDVLVARGNTFVPSAAGLLNKKLSIGAVNLTSGLLGILFGGFTGLKGGIGAPALFLRLRSMANILGDPKKARAFYKAMDNATSYKTRYSNFVRLVQMYTTDVMKEQYEEGTEAYEQHQREINELQQFYQLIQETLDNMPDDYQGDTFEEQMLNDVEIINNPPTEEQNISRGQGEIPSIQPINIPNIDIASLGGQGIGPTNPQTIAGLESVGLPLFTAKEGGIVDLFESKKFKRPQVVA